MSGEEHHVDYGSPGMTIRTRIASEQMAAMLGKSTNDDLSFIGLSHCALTAADALIAELNKEVDK